MKLGEIVVHMDNYNFTKIHQNQMKNKKVLLIALFLVQNFKVSVELSKSYIVRRLILDDIFLEARAKLLFKYYSETDAWKNFTSIDLSPFLFVLYSKK